MDYGAEKLTVFPKMKQRRDACPQCPPEIDLPCVIKKIGIRHQKDCTHQGNKRRSFFGMGIKGKTDCRKDNYTEDFLKAHRMIRNEI